MKEERTLIDRARQGDETAFASLVEQYQDRVYRLALRICGNSHDAEEAAQEAFVAAWRGLPAFRGESRFSSWLYQLTSNAAIDLLRREKRHRGNVPIEEEILPLSGDTPQQNAENAELRRSLQTALMTLTPEHREIFLLRQMQQLSYEEIGGMLGLESGTVKSRLNRAKKQLRQILLQQGNILPFPSVKGSEEGQKNV